MQLFLLNRVILVLLICGLVSISARAVEISNIYQVDVKVKEQSNNARLSASLEGLKQVLVRRSGSNRILNSNETTKAYRKVTSYLQKVEYSSVSEVVDDYQYIISLYFEPRLIDELIRRANQPLWDFNRPVTILWLAQEEMTESSSLYRRVITENSDEIDINTFISNNSKRRGVPIILPLMDLEDDLLVSQSDIWGRFPKAIINANKRYSVESMIIGKIYQRDEIWFGQFSYINKTKRVSFESQSEDVEVIYQQLFDNLAETLCDQYCVTQTINEESGLFIEIENVTSFTSFQVLKTYLSELEAVRQVDVLNIYQDNILLRLSLLSSEQTVIENLSLNPHLKLIVKDEEPIGKENLVMDIETEPKSENINEIDTNDITMLKEKIPTVKPNTIFYKWID